MMQSLVIRLNSLYLQGDIALLIIPESEGLGPTDM